MPNALQRMQAQQNLRSSPSINNKTPPYPCIALLYSRQARNDACKVVRFQNQREFDQCRTFTVARIRVALRDSDLAEIPSSVLLDVHNRARVSRGEQPLTEFADNLDAVEIQRLVFDDLPVVATTYEEIQMVEGEGTATATAAPATDKAAEKEAAKKAKQAEKEAKKVETAAKRADGVIGTIKSALDTNEGTTQNEVLDKLTAKFPDRTRDGMSSTVKIQFSRLAKSTGRVIHNANIEGRGRVYKFADKGPVPGKVVVEAPAAAPAPAGEGQPANVTSIEDAAAKSKAKAAKK